MSHLLFSTQSKCRELAPAKGVPVFDRAPCNENFAAVEFENDRFVDFLTERKDAVGPSINACPSRFLEAKQFVVLDIFSANDFCIPPSGYVVSWRLTEVFYLNFENGKINTRNKGTVRQEIGPQLPLGNVFCQLPLVFASVKQFVSRSPQREGEPSYGYGRESRNGGPQGVKNFADLDDKERKHAIGGAVFLFGLFGYFAYFVVTRDERKKQDDKRRASTEPKKPFPPRQP